VVTPSRKRRTKETAWTLTVLQTSRLSLPFRY